MLIPRVKAKEFIKYRFKKCKGVPSDTDCYYLCVARGRKMLFVLSVKGFKWCYATKEMKIGDVI